MSIAKRVGAIVAGVLTVTLVVTFGVLRTTEESRSFSTIQDQIVQQTKLLVQSITFAMGHGITDVAPCIAAVAQAKNVQELRILPSHQVKAGGEEQMDAAEKGVLASGQSIVAKETYNGVPVIRAVEPVIADEGCVACHSAAVGTPLATVSIRYSLAEHEAAVGTMRTLTAGLAGAAIVLILFGVMFMIKRQVLTDLGSAVRHLRILSEGDVTQDLHVDRTDEIGQLSESVKRLQDGLRSKTRAAIEVSRGDLLADVPLASDRDELGKSLQQAIVVLRSLVAETTTLTSSAMEGRLSVRGDAARFDGAYKEIVGGVNSTLDAVIGPLHVSAEYMDRIARGDIPAKIVEEYRGDFNAIKTTLNTCIDAVNGLVADATKLSTAAVAGQLSVRSDAASAPGGLPENHGGSERHAGCVDASGGRQCAGVEPDGGGGFDGAGGGGVSRGSPEDRGEYQYGGGIAGAGDAGSE